MQCRGVLEEGRGRVRVEEVRSLLTSTMTMRDAGIVPDDVLEMIPDPEGGA